MLHIKALIYSHLFKWEFSSDFQEVTISDSAKLGNKGGETNKDWWDNINF